MVETTRAYGRFAHTRCMHNRGGSSAFGWAFPNFSIWGARKGEGPEMNRLTRGGDSPSKCAALIRAATSEEVFARLAGGGLFP